MGKYKVANSDSPTITEVTISVNTPPTTQNVIGDLNSINNSTNARTSLYTTQGNGPQIAPAGPYSNVATLPNTTSLAQGAEISVDIDQVGSGSVGANLTVMVRGT